MKLTRGTARGAPRDQSGKPGAGKGRKEDVRGSGIYPASGPWPPGRAKVKTAGSMGRRQPSAAAASSGAAIVRRSTVRGRTSAATVTTLPKRAVVRRKIASELRQTPRDIARKNWNEFLDDFSAEHEGWATELQIFQPDQTSRIEARDLPLVGVSIDFEPGDAVVSTILGNKGPDHITHIVSRITRITLLKEHELEIADADRGRTIVRCQQPQR